MTELLWDDVRDIFDPTVNGVLPDVRVLETSLADWQALLDLTRSEGWRHEYEEDGLPNALPDRASDIIDRIVTAFPAISIWPVPSLRAIVRPAASTEIEFDVDLRELQGQEALDNLCAFIRSIGHRLRKRVLMYPEGSTVAPDLGYLPETDRVADSHRQGEASHP